MNRTEIHAVLRTNMAAVIAGFGDREVPEAASLVADFGADSLQVVEIVSRTMRAANVRMKRTELNKAKNVGELLDLFEAAQAKPAAG
jgi:acyl carrier protein